MKEDSTAFEEWMGRYSRDIERFAFQYGCSSEQAAQVAEETFYEIFTDREKMAEGKHYVYKIALERLRRTERLTPTTVSSIAFEEDAEFHLNITKLDDEYRIPLVLHLFHGFSVEEIAAVTNNPTSEVEANIPAAKVLLRKAIWNPPVEIVEKRLGFLGKSYDRLPSLFNIDNVTSKEILPSATEHKKLARKGWITAIIFGVLLVGLIGSTFFTGENWELRSDRQYMEGLKKEFEERADEKQEILGVSDAVFNQIPFIRDTKAQFSGIMVELENQNSEGEKIDRQLAEAWLLELTEAMKLPSELADELFASPLINDAERSMMFVRGYLEKEDAIKYSLFEYYADDYYKLREAFIAEEFDAKAILAQQDAYSESTIDFIKALTSQNIGPVLHEEAFRLNVDSEFIAQLRAALHELAGSQLMQYEKEPFILDNKLRYSLEETIGFIEEMEQTVVTAKQNQWIGHYMEGVLLNLLEAILQGKTIEEFKNSDGSIGEVHRDAWKQLASLGPDSGVGAIMTKIVEEMEASNWQRSDLRNSLDDWRIYEAYSFAVEGNLEQFGMKPLKEMYDDLTYILPDSQLDDAVANLYDEFSVAYDRDILKNVHPLFVVSLFYYANDKGDSAMMWHLMDPASRVSSLEEYDAKEIVLLDMTESIRFNPSLIMDDGHQVLAPIEFKRDGKTFYNVWMTYAEEQVWQVESIVIEEGSL